MNAAADTARAHALVDALLGPSDAAADRAVAVLKAQAAALAWVCDTTGAYPAPGSIIDTLAAVAERLRRDDSRDPVAVLGQAAVDALAALRAHAAT